MNKFKVGDPVKVHDEEGREGYDNKEGVIIDRREGAGWPYIVKFPNGDYDGFKESELELIQ